MPTSDRIGEPERRQGYHLETNANILMCCTHLVRVARISLRVDVLLAYVPAKHTHSARLRACETHPHLVANCLYKRIRMAGETHFHMIYMRRIYIYIYIYILRERDGDR
jgi:hypothetical protein